MISVHGELFAFDGTDDFGQISDGETFAMFHSSSTWFWDSLFYQTFALCIRCLQNQSKLSKTRKSINCTSVELEQLLPKTLKSERKINKLNNICYRTCWKIKGNIKIFDRFSECDGFAVWAVLANTHGMKDKTTSQNLGKSMKNLRISKGIYGYLEISTDKTTSQNLRESMKKPKDS